MEIFEAEAVINNEPARESVTTKHLTKNQAPRIGKIKASLSRLKHSKPTLFWLLNTMWFRRNFRFNTKSIRGKNNQLATRGAVLNAVKFDIVGAHNRIEIGSMAILDNVTFHVRGSNNRVSIGADCRISGSTLWIEDDRCEIRIGPLTTFGGAHLAATEDHSKIDIGNDCMLASGIDIRTGDSHAIFDGFGQRINEAQDVIIGDHVWVAARATILKGAIIGPGSIVGTGAVVTNGNYPAQSILAGNPVKLVRQNIQWTRSRRK